MGQTQRPGDWGGGGGGEAVWGRVGATIFFAHWHQLREAEHIKRTERHFQEGRGKLRQTGGGTTLIGEGGGKNPRIMNGNHGKFAPLEVATLPFQQFCPPENI